LPRRLVGCGEVPFAEPERTTTILTDYAPKD
jgi:hypothetical protein